MKVSVVVPVFNVEFYLEKAIRSMMRQNLNDIEIILVDDGATDNSGAICDSLAEEDKRIKVLHIKNSGAANARNQGIKISRGKYLYFMDPDDWCDKHLLESMYNLAESKSANLVVQGFINEYSIGKDYFSVPQKADSAFYESKENVRNNIFKYFNNTLIAVPWNKLYKADYIKSNQLEFPNVKWDDLHFNMEVIKDIDRIAISDEAHYHFFRTRPGSETTKVFDRSLFSKRVEQFQHILEIYKYWQLDNIKSDEAINYYFCGRVFQYIQELSVSSYDYNTKYRETKKILNSDIVKEAISKQNGPSKLMEVFIKLMKNKNTRLLLIIGKLITFVKNNFSKMFYRIRRNYLIKG